VNGVLLFGWSTARIFRCCTGPSGATPNGKADIGGLA